MTDNDSKQTQKPTHPRKKRRRIWNCVTAILAVELLAILIYLVTVAFATSPFFSNWLLKKSVANYNLAFETSDINFSIATGLDIDLKKISILSDSGNEMAKADELLINLNVIDYIIGKNIISHFELTNMVGKITKNKDGLFDHKFLNSLTNYTTTEFDDKNIGKNIFSAVDRLLPNNLYLSNLTVLFEDQSVAYETKTTKIKNLNLLSSTQSDSKLVMSGQIEQQSGDSQFLVQAEVDNKFFYPDTISLQVTIDQIDTTFWSPYTDKLLPISNVETVASIDADIWFNQYSKFKVKSSIVLSRANLEIAKYYGSTLMVKPLTLTLDIEGRSINSITLHSVKLAQGGDTLSVSGKIDDLISSNPYLDLSLSSSRINVELFKKLVPDKNITLALKDFLIDGIVSGKFIISNFSYKGRLRDALNVDLIKSKNPFTATIQLIDCNFVISQFPSDVLTISGTLKLADDSLILDGSSGMYNLSTLKSLSFRMDRIFEDHPDIFATINASINLSELVLYLKRLALHRLEEDLKIFQTISGDIDLELAIRAISYKKSEPIQVRGDISFHDVSIQSEHLPFEIENINGTITTSGNRAEIVNLDATILNSSVRLQGEIDKFSSNPIINLNFKSDLSVNDLELISFLKPKKKPLFKPEGKILIDGRVSGDFDNITFQIDSDLTSAKYQTLYVIRKANFSKTKIQFNGILKDRRRVIIEDSYLLLGDRTKLQVDGFVNLFSESPDLHIVAKSDHIEGDDVDANFSFIDDIDSEGIGHGLFSIAKSPGSDIELGGFISITAARFRLPILSATFENVNGMIELDSDRFFIKKATGKFGDGNFELQGYGNFLSPRNFFINANTSSLSVRDILGTPEHKQSDQPLSTRNVATYQTNKKNIFNGKWEIKIQSDAGNIDFIPYNDLDLTLVFDNDIYAINRLNFRAYDGWWNAPLQIKLLTDDSISIAGKVRVTGFEFGKFLADNIDDTALIEASATLVGEYSSRGRGYNEILSEISGKVDLASSPGVIKQFDVLNKIFQILNINTLFKNKTYDMKSGGIPFHYISSDIYIYRGVATTDNLLMASDSINISGSGSYNILEDYTDFTVGVSPLGGIENSIRPIPFIGYVLVGGRHSILSATFGVTGEIKDMEIKTKQISGFLGGVFGMVKRFFSKISSVRSKSELESAENNL